MKIECLDNSENKKIDFIITTVPWIDTNLPLMAPAALKPIIEKCGYSCLAIDLNIEIFNIITIHPLKDELIKFFFDGVADNEAANFLHNLFKNIATKIISYKPKYVGLSLFSYVCQQSGKWIAYYIKKLNPKIKILIGGAGCLDTFTGPSEFVNFMLNEKLADWHIRGDGERSLIELLNGNNDYNGINTPSWQELSREEVRSLPYPDYDDYNFANYRKRILPLVGSRGCVRKCTFCDYISNWKNFHWREAEEIFNEMLIQNKKYNIRNFKFQDSLTNGNQKEFLKFLKLLANYNTKNPNNSFSWSGYFIFRNISQSSEHEWELIAKSGANVLSVGVENLNEDIRYAMGKKFTNESIDFYLKQAKKYNIKITLLNIVGYITETQTHINYIKNWLATHIEYKDTLVIQWGGTLGIFPNTFLDNNKEKLGITKIGPLPNEWINPSINSTPKIRAQWTIDLMNYSKKLGYNVVDNLDNHFVLESLIKNNV